MRQGMPWGSTGQDSRLSLPGARFDHWSGNKDPKSQVAEHKNKKPKKRKENRTTFK